MGISTLGKVLFGAAVAAEAFVTLTSESDYIRPPGFQSEADFSSRCIRCLKCLQACPYESIVPVRDLLNQASGTPEIDVRTRACRMCEDFPCVDVCPTGALRDCASREEVRMGTAVIDEEKCIAFDGMRCEVCYRACPLIDQAITIDFRARENDAIHKVFAPIIHEDVCTGCGLCVERCVTDEPSIYIVQKEKWNADLGKTSA